MNGIGGKPKSWSESFPATPSGTGDKSQAAFRDSGSSINALSFGFLATAILVSMFLIMAIFEHLLRARSSHTPSQSGAHGSLAMPQERHQIDAKKKNKLQNEATTTTAVDLSVLMPGQQYPTYIAQPAPLRPCPREGILWSAQDCHAFSLP